MLLVAKFGQDNTVELRLSARDLGASAQRLCRLARRHDRIGDFALVRQNGVSFRIEGQDLHLVFGHVGDGHRGDFDHRRFRHSRTSRRRWHRFGVPDHHLQGQVRTHATLAMYPIEKLFEDSDFFSSVHGATSCVPMQTGDDRTPVFSSAKACPHVACGTGGDHQKACPHPVVFEVNHVRGRTRQRAERGLE